MKTLTLLNNLQSIKYFISTLKRFENLNSYLWLKTLVTESLQENFDTIQKLQSFKHLIQTLKRYKNLKSYLSYTAAYMRF